MGRITFYLLNRKETDYIGFNSLIDSRLEGKEVSYISLEQLNDKSFNSLLKPDNIDYYFNPYDEIEINIEKVKEALKKGINFHIKTNKRNLTKLKEVFKEVGFTYEY